MLDFTADHIGSLSQIEGFKVSSLIPWTVMNSYHTVYTLNAIKVTLDKSN